MGKIRQAWGRLRWTLFRIPTRKMCGAVWLLKLDGVTVGSHSCHRREGHKGSHRCSCGVKGESSPRREGGRDSEGALPAVLPGSDSVTSLPAPLPPPLARIKAAGEDWRKLLAAAEKLNRKGGSGAGGSKAAG